MKTKIRAYMKSAEFKTKQLWLPFVDACGIALEAISGQMEAMRDWYKAWVKGFRTAIEIKKPVQLTINFLARQRSILDWADWRPEKNLQLFN